MSRPVRSNYKGFEKITLKPTAKVKTVSFPIDIEALKFWNQQMKYDAERQSSTSLSAWIPLALNKDRSSYCKPAVNRAR